MWGITVMSQEKGLDEWMSNQFCKFDDMIDNGANLFRWSETRLNILNKQNKKSWLILWEALINTVTCSPKTEPKVAKRFERKSSIPIQIWWSKNDDIQIHQYIGMSQDLNPNQSTCSLEMARVANVRFTGGPLTIFLAVGLHRAATSRPLMLKKTFKIFWVERTTRWQ